MYFPPGGSFVLKVFTVFEPATVGLLHLLRMSFEELHAFKPCTSKEGNSEMYLVAAKYQRSEQIIRCWDQLKDRLFNRDADLISTGLIFPAPSLQPSFLADVVDCAGLFKGHQEEAIMRNLSLYNLPTEDPDEDLQRRVALRYVSRYRLKKISPRQFIVSQKRWRTPEWKADLVPAGSTRTALLQTPKTAADWFPLKTELIFMRDNINHFSAGSPLVWEWTDRSHWTDRISLTEGRPYDRILSSKFCHIRILHVCSSLAMKSDDPRKSRIDAFFLGDHQKALLESFSKNDPGPDFQFKDEPLLSRFAVGSLWALSLLYQTVIIW